MAGYFGCQDCLEVMVAQMGWADLGPQRSTAHLRSETVEAELLQKSDLFRFPLLEFRQCRQNAEEMIQQLRYHRRQNAR